MIISIDDTIKDIARVANVPEIRRFEIYVLEAVFDPEGKIYSADNCPDKVKAAFQKASDLCQQRLGRGIDWVVC